MNIQDAANMLGINGNVTPEIAKQAYRKASMKYHPDRNPAGLEMMKAINAAYDVLRDLECNVDVESSGYDEALNDAINAVIYCDGVVVEICGNWVWLSGNTKEHKEIIKEAGYKWASKKGMWYFRPDEWKSSNRINFSINDIRTNHGSQIVSKRSMQAIA